MGSPWDESWRFFRLMNASKLAHEVRTICDDAVDPHIHQFSSLRDLINRPDMNSSPLTMGSFNEGRCHKGTPYRVKRCGTWYAFPWDCAICML